MAALSSERSTSGGGVVSSRMTSMTESASCVPMAMTRLSSWWRRRRREPSDVAEVEDGQMLAVREQEVPGMGIGVVEAIPEDHLQVDVRRPLDQFFDVPPGRLDAGAIAEGMAGNHRHRQHPLSRPVGVGRGDHDVGFVSEVLAESLEVGQLLPEIDGAVHHRRELVDQDRGPELGDLRIARLQMSGDGPHELDVIADLGVGAVVQHLHRHLRYRPRAWPGALAPRTRMRTAPTRRSRTSR